MNHQGTSTPIILTSKRQLNVSLRASKAPRWIFIGLHLIKPHYRVSWELGISKALYYSALT